MYSAGIDIAARESMPRQGCFSRFGVTRLIFICLCFCSLVATSAEAAGAVRIEKVSLWSFLQAKTAVPYACHSDGSGRKAGFGKLNTPKIKVGRTLWRALTSRKTKRLLAEFRREKSRCRSALLCARADKRLKAIKAAVKACSKFKPEEPTTGVELTKPVALVPADFTVLEGATVLLDGSGSQAQTGSALEYIWEQVAGPEVTLLDHEAGKKRFIAELSPRPLETEELVFKLVVKEGELFSDPALLTVKIDPLPGVCGDSFCSRDEVAAVCPWDCRVAVQTQQRKVQYPAYWTRRALEFQLSGELTEVATPAAVRDYLLPRLSLTVNGNVYMPHEIQHYSDDMIALKYLQMNSVWDYQTTLWDRVKDDERVFVHAANMPETPASRLQMRCDDGQYLTYPGEAWRSYYAEEANRQIALNPRFDGIFMDNGLGRLLVTNRYWRRVENEAHTVSQDGMTISLPLANLHLRNSSYPCDNNVSAFDNQAGLGTDYFPGGTVSANLITLGTAVSPGSTVYLSYWVVDIPSADIIASWPTDMAESFAYIKQALGNKLFIYNGIYWAWTEDEPLTAIADGGMDEEFVYPPWQVPGQNVSEAKWTDQVAKLNDISSRKIFLAQAGVSAGTLDAAKIIQVNKIALFSYTSFLLGMQKHAYFNFAVGPGSYQNYAHFEFQDVDLGAPLAGAQGTYHILQNENGIKIYEREFEKALVLVNPGSGTSPGHISLNRNYRTLTGDTISSLDLGSQTGIILLK